MDESGNHKQAEQRERIRWIVSILIPLLCALLSFCVIAKYTSSPTMKINAHAIQSLDDKKTTASELTERQRLLLPQLRLFREMPVLRLRINWPI